MPMASPLISVIMPAFNAERFIGMAIQSVLRQTYGNWELLVINDGSRDNTGKIAGSFLDKRVKVLSQKNKGVGVARNIGLDQSQGDYFVFLDADDMLTKNSIHSRLKIFEKDESIDFVDGSVAFYDSQFLTRLKIWSPDYKGNPLSDLLQLTGKCFFGPSWMVKRKPINVYKFKDHLTHGEDLLFYIDLAIQGGAYDYTNEIVLKYRTGHHSAMSDLTGLERGYRQISEELLKTSGIDVKLVQAFKKKAHRIMLRSYFGKGEFLKGLNFLMRPW